MSKKANLALCLVLGASLGFLVSSEEGILAGGLLGSLYWWYFARRHRKRGKAGGLARLGEQIVESHVTDLGNGIALLVCMLVSMLPTLVVAYAVGNIGEMLGAGDDGYFYGTLLAVLLIWFPLSLKLAFALQKRHGDRLIRRLLGKHSAEECESTTSKPTPIANSPDLREKG